MERYRKIITLQNAFEAKRMELVLSELGIPHIIRSYHDSAYDGLYQVVKGWGHVEAPKEYEVQIKELYRGLPGQPVPGEPEDEDIPLDDDR